MCSSPTTVFLGTTFICLGGGEISIHIRITLTCLGGEISIYKNKDNSHMKNSDLSQEVDSVFMCILRFYCLSVKHVLFAS